MCAKVYIDVRDAMKVNDLYGEMIYWIETHDGDPFMRELADRHYSREKPGSKCFVGVGEKIVLKTPDSKALFAWLYSDPKLRLDNLDGINCTIFRNESNVLSSKLILEAEKFAIEKWGKNKSELMLFTYVNEDKVKSTYPGYCFKKAGWEYVRKNKSGKLRLFVKKVILK